MGRINDDAAFFMSYVRGEDRGQAALVPAAVEDYVAADAPVRLIEAFVDGPARARGGLPVINAAFNVLPASLMPALDQKAGITVGSLWMWQN
jgi:hypothetical protein